MWRSVGSVLAFLSLVLISQPGSARAAASDAPSEISIPREPSGSSSLLQGQSTYFLSGGASCDGTTAVEYQFDWGDGSLSDWRASAGKNPVPPAGSAMASIASSAGADPSADVERLLPLVRARGSIRVIVSLRGDVQPEAALRPIDVTAQRAWIAGAQDALLEALAGTRVRELRRFRSVPGMALAVDEAGLDALGRDARVSRIREDRVLRPALRESVPLIGAPAAWAAGYSGQGQVVAILDTGIDREHPLLRGRIVAEGCFSSSNVFGDPNDLHDPTSWSRSVCPRGDTSVAGPGSAVPLGSHGTQVAAIAAGNGSDIAGVAPAASVIAVQVFSNYQSGGVSWTSDVVAGLEYVLELSSAYPIAAVNMSIASDVGDGDCDSPIDGMYEVRQMIGILRAAGVATVVASGNGYLTDRVQAPACLPDAIAVGSTTMDDRVSIFSNVGPSLDLFAPGEAILSAGAGGGLVEANGTSMAAPHVTGAWALLRSRNPGATVDEILEALVSTGLPVTDDREGAGSALVRPRIQVDRAIEALAPGGAEERAGDAIEFHEWGESGEYAVRARARCAATPDLISSWSEPYPVAVAVRDRLSTPTLSGSTAGLAGEAIEFRAAGSSSPLGSAFEYVFSWGDGSADTLASADGVASHRWRRPGNYDVVVLAKGFTRDLRSSWSEPLQVSITIQDAPDLIGRWERITASCKGHKDNRSCRVKARLWVQNVGDGVARSTTAAVRLSADGTLSSDDPSVWTLRVKPLAPGEERLVEFSARLGPAATKGRPYLIVTLDALGNLVEYDLNNNAIEARRWEPGSQ